MKKVLWLWQMTRGQRLMMLASCLVGTIQVFSSLGFVWFCKQLIDDVTRATGRNLTLDTVWMLSCIVLVITSSGGVSWLRDQCGMKSSNKLRSRLFSCLLNSRLEKEQKLHSGDIMNRLGQDMGTISSVIAKDIPDLFLLLIRLVSASLFLLYLDKRLLWVLLTLLPIAFLFSKVFYKKLKGLTDNIRRQEGEISSLMQEYIQHRTLIQSLCYVPTALEKLDDKQTHLYQTVTTKSLFSLYSRLLLQVGFSGGYCVAFLWGIYGIQQGTVTFGMMVAFLQLVAQIQYPLVNLTHYVPLFITLVTAIERLQIITNSQQETIGEKQLLKGPLGIRLNQVGYTYPGGNRPILRQLSFDFKPGSTTAIVGETGAGKSTLIRLLLSQLSPQQGQIVLYNAQGQTVCSPATRCNYMVVPQGNSLFSGTIRENLQMANPAATDQQMTEALTQASAQFVFQREGGLNSKCGEQGDGLSEGQAQRIAIARALLQEGEILVLDEASSALDTQTEQEILDTLARIQDKTIIWVTHHPQVTENMHQVLRIDTIQTTENLGYSTSNRILY